MPLQSQGRIGSIGILVLVAGLSIACARNDGSENILYIAFPPPPPPVELEGAPPSNSYVWVSGHYEWNGVEYVWFPGAWQARPYAKATWISGRWQLTRLGWRWVEGHWS